MPDDPVPPAIRERLRHDDHSGLPKASIFMPLVAIIVFLALFYARRAVMQMEEGHSSISLPEATEQIVLPSQPEVPSSMPTDSEGPLVEALPAAAAEKAAEAIPAPLTNDVVPEAVAPSVPNATNVVEDVIITYDSVPGVPAVVAEPSAPLDPNAWPLFKLKGIATGGENLVMLDTGEMLAAGEKSKVGVRVSHVEPSQATFSWHGEKKTMRRGETSDKVTDEEEQSDED